MNIGSLGYGRNYFQKLQQMRHSVSIARPGCISTGNFIEMVARFGLFNL